MTTGIPVSRMLQSDRERLAHLDEHLAEVAQVSHRPVRAEQVHGLGGPVVVLARGVFDAAHQRQRALGAANRELGAARPEAYGTAQDLHHALRPSRALTDEGPVYRRPTKEPEWQRRVQQLDFERLGPPVDAAHAFAVH